MPQINLKPNKDDFSRTLDIVRGDDGFYRYLVNKGMYIDASNISPAMVTMYEVKTNDTYTKISFNFYGTIGLWWLVCKMNGVTNPFTILNPGTVLTILNRDYVNSIVYPAMDKVQQMYAGSTVNQ